jgi:hypothetical protein
MLSPDVVQAVRAVGPSTPDLRQLLSRALRELQRGDQGSSNGLASVGGVLEFVRLDAASASQTTSSAPAAASSVNALATTETRISDDNRVFSSTVPNVSTATLLGPSDSRTTTGLSGGLARTPFTPGSASGAALAAIATPPAVLAEGAASTSQTPVDEQRREVNDDGDDDDPSSHDFLPAQHADDSIFAARDIRRRTSADTPTTLAPLSRASVCAALSRHSCDAPSYPASLHHARCGMQRIRRCSWLASTRRSSRCALAGATSGARRRSASTTRIIGL